jgi:hypothetical protein
LDQVTGRVQGATDTTLTVRFKYPHGTKRLLRSSITEMDVSVGKDRRVGKGMGVGLLLGAGLGAMIGLASGDDEPGWFSLGAEDKAVMVGAALGVVGAVGGLLAGLSGTDRWASVTPAGADLTILPLVAAEGAGLHVGLSIPIR